MKRQEHNQYVLHSDYAECFVYSLNHKLNGSFIIDLDDVDKCKEHRWYLKKDKNKFVAVVTDIDNKRIYLHRYLLEYYEDKQIDHINRNPLDNRKYNLRIVSCLENNANKNGKNLQQYPHGKYKCLFTRYGKQFYLGYFNTKEEANKAKQEKLKEIEENKEYYIKLFNEESAESSLGVTHIPSGKWRADVIRNGNRIRIGTFNTAAEAKQARDLFIASLQQ